MNRPSLVELFLIEVVLLLLIWLMHHYVASLLSLVIPSIALSILILSLIFDFIEPAKIPRWYYGYLIITILAPLLIAFVFIAMNGFVIPWLE